MALTAAQLQVVVTANTAAAEAGLASVGAQAKAFAATAAGVHMGALISVAAIAGIGVAAGLAAKQAADFQTQLTQLVTGAGESASNLDLVRRGILAMAPAVGQTTDQLTAGLYMIESAGFHGAAGLTVLRAAAMGAKVGAADLETVANGVTTLLVDFKGANLSAAAATNILVATVANGKTHMQDLASSIAAVAPSASAAHVSVIDMAAAMATMTGNGVPAAEAATYLRQMLIELNAPSAGAKKALGEIGLTTDEVAAAMHRSLPEALQLIQSHLLKMYKEGSPQYMEAIKNISGGLRQMQAMLNLTGGHLDTFSANVKNISAAVAKGGSAVTGWTDVQATFNQKLSQAGAAVQVLAITLGTYLLPPLTKVAGAVGDAITRFTPFLVSIISNQDAMAKLAPVAGVLAGVLGGVFVASLISLAAAAWAALAPFLVFAAPFIAVGAGIAALIIGLNFLGQKFGWWKNIMDPINGVLQFLAKNGDMVRTVLLALAAGVAVVMLPTIGGLIAGFIGWAIAATGAAIATIAATWPILLVIAAVALLVIGIKLLIDHWKQVSDFLGNVWKAIVAGAQDDLKQWGDTISVVCGVINGAFGAMGNFVSGVWQNLVGGVKAQVNGIIDIINGMIRAINGIHINIPSIGPFGGGSIGFRLPTIPHMASGGLVAQGGLALVGERGPEVVMLPGGASVLPNSQSRTLAQGGGAGKEQTIIIQLDGRVLAKQTVKHMPAVIRLATGARSF
jgi:TP901 family phage tail tape measure protein